MPCFDRELHYVSTIINHQSLMFHLVEAKEVLDGGGRVEDVAFSRHHQHKAVQRLETKEKPPSYPVIF